MMTTATGLKKMDVWLGDGKWDVIHFNFGIHDRATPISNYTQRLEQLIERMKKTGAKLDWASTMPIPDDPVHNQTAASIVAPPQSQPDRRLKPMDLNNQFPVNNAAPPTSHEKTRHSQRHCYLP